MSDINRNLTDDSAETVIEKKSSFINEIADYMEMIAFALIFVVLALTFIFRVCTVEGDSMIDTLHGGDKIIVSDTFYTPKRGDIIVLHQTGNDYNQAMVKRVIGVGGDTVVINHSTNEVWITDKDGNTEKLEEEYLTLINYPLYAGISTYEVPENKLFVMGDNRNNSLDSRNSYQIGYVDSRRVLGKVIFRLTPFSDFGTVK